MARRRQGGREGGPGADAGADLDPAWVGRVREKLVAWYAEAGRELPWRADPDPYRVLVSEMMLVQTTVTAVVPFFERFLRRFPTFESLADADEADVLKAWEGLGYYRRARQLQAAARAVVGRHGGVVPDDLDAVRALPGVGRYIAGALLSFAYDRPVPIVEANTQRVLARWLAWRGELRTASTQARLWEAAARLVPPEGAGRFNQAFMDLGALICTPRSPRCLFCPVAAECQARALGIQDQVPVTAPRPAPLDVAEACALVRKGEQFLVVQRGPGGLWDGFWEFPTVHAGGADPAGRVAAAGGAPDLAAGVRALTGVAVDTESEPALTVRYGVTRHRVRLDAYAARPTGRASTRGLAPAPGFRRVEWVERGDLGGRPFSSAGRKLVAWLVRGGPGGDGTGHPGNP